MVDMLDGIEPVAAALQGIDQPFPPVQHLPLNIFVAVVNVSEHQIIIVAEFVVHILVPGPVLAVDPEYPGPAFFGVKVCTVKMGVIPFEGGILLAAPRKGEFGPALNLERLGDILGAVVGIHLNYLEGLCLICTGFMVHNEIDVDRDAVLQALGNRLDQLLLRAVFGPDRTFLVEFAQIIEIVHPIPGVLAGDGLGYRRNPDRIDIGCLDIRGHLSQPLPVLSVRFNMPLKKLHHRMVSLHLYNLLYM
ncbi:hypothetical protein D3C80_1273960 [compost metagenome]